jgi:hypothetical protein
MPRELAPGVIERELANLRAELNPPITAEMLDRWIGRIRDRQAMFADSVWGKIRWPKSLGRPLASSLVDAFFIEHIHWSKRLDLITGQYVDIITPQREPSKWDVPDAQYYQVTFMTQAAQEYKNQIRVNFSPQIAWEHVVDIAGRAHREIEPPLRTFTPENAMLILDPFEVVAKP